MTGLDQLEKNNYYKRVVCDIDDTLSFTTDRGFEFAFPNMELITKLNQLYDSGWEIVLLTARGQLSCDGDHILAEKKYGGQIKSWLKKYKVKYHYLSFNKILASYYIDDKNLQPSEFLDLEIKELKSGWSGAIVEKRGSRVYKTHQNSLQAALWYDTARYYFNVPKVHSVIGNTICMDFIESSGNINLLDTLNLVKEFENMQPIYGEEPFGTYIDKIRKHCGVNNKFFGVIPLLLEIEERMDMIGNTFSHGDFSLENLIPSEGKIFLIDPINQNGVFSNYLLDVAKLAHSFRKIDRMREVEFIYNYFSEEIPSSMLVVLEISQWVRVYKYAPNDKKEFIEQTILKLLPDVK